MSDPKPERAMMTRVAIGAFVYAFVGVLLVLGLTPVWSRWFR